MSYRVIRKLQGGDALKNASNAENVEDSVSESDGDSKEQKEKMRNNKKLSVNRFELLNNVTNSFSDTEAKEDDDKELESKVQASNNELDSDKSRADKQASSDSLKRRRKKKKKLRNQRSIENQLSHEDDIDANVREVNQILGDATQAVALHKQEDPKSKAHKSLVYVESRNLNPENEMKRIFGSKTVQLEQTLAHGRRKGRTSRAAVCRNWIFVSPKNWQNIGKPPIHMEHVSTVGEGCNTQLFFTFVHTKTYQTVQFDFLNAVESYNPENLVAILNAHPYHIDTLIQFSDVCKMGEDHQMAAELIERALYCFESVFHPLFTVTQGNCRLDYRRPENRSLFIALFKHIDFVGQRGCNRTALELCKFLLGLDLKGDPLCVLQMVDFHAIRSEQFDYLIQMYAEWADSKKLQLFPNFRFNVALAYFLKSEADAALLSIADQMLQDALLLFPNVLMQLIDKCGVEPDKEISGCKYFTQPSHVSQSLQHLSAIFVGRNHLLWKERNTMFWLERNTRATVVRIKEKDPYVSECEEKRKQYFSQGTPKNVLRHIILSGIKEATGLFPSDLANSAVFAFDPLPPSDSIVSYSRPQLTQRVQPNDSQNILSLFLRSWLPDFQVDGAVGGQQNINVERRINGAQRREGNEGNDLRRSVTSLLDAMRDLLNNIDMADVPNEGDVEESEDERRNP